VTPAFEHDRCIRVVAMSAEGARAFGTRDATKVVCVGQVIGPTYRFGARVYLLFATIADYNAWLREGRPGLEAAP